MEILISIGAKIAEYTVGPVIHQLGYVVHFNRNIKDLKEAVQKLGMCREGVKHRVEAAQRNAEDIEVMVIDWLNGVDAIIGEYNLFNENDGGANNECFNQSRVNFYRRHRLSRRAKKLRERVLQIKEDGNFERVSHLRDPQEHISFIHGESNYVNFKSRDSTKENILKALKGSEFNVIGVYGMGGVGKTELAKEILKIVKETKLFKTMVWSTISQDPNVENIQQDIGDMLGLSFEEKSIQGRASKLLKRLHDVENVLIVLDDIWKELDLKNVGIPCERCKILVTSRDKDLLQNKMKVQMNFEIKALDEEESWNFFKKVINVENRDLDSIAYEVASECDGLPIALITIAKALEGKPLPIWQDALDQIQSSEVVNINGMTEKVYSLFQLSYNFLENEETKNIFLLCSMYPEDYDIGVEDDLLRYAVGMRLLDSHGNGNMTITKARNRIIKLIDDLKSSSLLLESEEEGNYVKMHDVIRDFARSFVLKHEEMSIRNNNVIFEHCDDFDNISRSLKFSELELLVLTSNYRDLEIPQAFFNGMDRIKVVEFKRCGISTLPSSLCSLTNLRALSLLECPYLENIDSIKDIKGLEILSLRNSSIKELPLCISQLTQLKVLDLKGCKRLVISSNIISRLTNLEELDLKNSFNGWEGEHLNNKKEMASLSELKCLPHLEALHIRIPNEKILSEQILSKGSKLERFEIIIGEELLYRLYRDREFNKSLTLNLKSRIVFSNDLKKLVNSAEEIELGGLIGENEVFSKFGEFHLSPQLKHLSIYENSDIDCIISEADPHLLQALAALEFLCLWKMKNLESIICNDMIPRAICFKRLRNIQVTNCHKMGNLFAFSLMKCLPNLQSIKVVNCRIMEGIVAMENQSDKLQLHQLKSLTLQRLPECISFCLEVDRRRQFDIIEEGTNFNPFFSERTEFVNLEELQIFGIHNLKMIWHDKHIVDSFSQIKRIHIRYCQSLRKVFSSSLIKTLKALEEVRVEGCDLLKEIFEINNDLSREEKYDDFVKIPMRSLILIRLPIINHVWSEDPKKISLTFPTLEEISIDECPKLISIFPVSFTEFNLLRKIQIEGCKSLRKIFPSNIMGAFEALIEIRIMKCESLEEIFEIDEKEITSNSQLEILVLRDLPNLNHVWNADLEDFSVFEKLRDVQVVECPKIRTIFPAAFGKYHQPQLQRLHIQSPGLEGIFKTLGNESFFHKVFLSNLEVLKLECHERAMIKFFEYMKCPRLVDLELISVGYDPRAFDKVMPKLEKSKMENMFIKEIFSENRKPAATLSRLYLAKFPKLMQMSRSFQNLEELIIIRCHGLTYLLPCSVAKSLLQLDRIRVEDCKKITSIIGEDEETEIVFSKLTRLKLYSLPRVEGFHLGKCTLKFPCLDSLKIIQCREMKTFSLGRITTTPLLKGIETFTSKLLSVDNDINVTIRKYWEEMDHNIFQNLFKEENHDFVGI